MARFFYFFLLLCFVLLVVWFGMGFYFEILFCFFVGRLEGQRAESRGEKDERDHDA